MKNKVNIGLLALLFVMQTSPIVISAQEISANSTDNQTELTQDNTLDDSVAEETTTEETTTEDVVTEETTIEDAVSEEATTEDAVSEETATEDVVTEETTTEDAVAEETTTEDAVAEETTTEDVVADETTTEDVEAEDVETTNATLADSETLELNLTEATTAEDEVTVQKQSANITDAYGNSEVIDLSNNPDKAESGKYELTFDVDTMTLVEDASTMRSIDEDAMQVESNVDNIEIDTTLAATPTSEDVNTLLENISGDDFLVSSDGEIIAADETSFITIGGYDYTTYVYDSLENFGDITNGVSVHGGAQNGKYLETVYYEGNYYAHVIIGGYEGYMDLNDIQILPGEFETAEEYYENVNGDWTKFVPVDALTSTEYTEYAVGSAPEWAEPGVEYYSTDDETFYTDTIANSRSTKAVATGSSYFQNLPFRSTSDYTAAQMKQYLNYVGFSSSEYYNETAAFVKAQEVYGINALFLFAFANHEGYYGTSTYSKLCNNFFGRGAIDSDPDQACEGSYGWPTATDGILSEARFVTQMYADVNDWRYYGTNPGNKQQGMNAVYASDTNWGNAIANHEYRMDQYFGGKEEGKYRIYAIKNSEPSYTTSSLSTTVKEMGFGTNNNTTSASGSETYYQHRQTNTGYGQTSAAQIRVVVTDETSSAFEYQIDMPLAQSTGYQQFSLGYSGVYPYFEGGSSFAYGGSGQTYANYIVKGYANSNATYGNTWTNQQVWYPKTADGSYTYSVINDVKAVSPGTSSTTEDKETKYYQANGSTATSGDSLSYAYTYVNGKLKYIYNYYPGTIMGQSHGSHIKYRFELNSDGTIKNCKKTADNTGVITNYYEYYSGTKYGSHGSHIKYRFDIDSSGYIYKATKYSDNAQKALSYYTYYSGTKYGSHGKHIYNRFDLDSSGYLSKAVTYNNNSNTEKYIYNYYPNTKYGSHGNHIKTRFTIKSGYVTEAYSYTDNYKKNTYIYNYYPNTVYGTHGDHIKYRFTIDSSGYVDIAYKYADVSKQLIRKYWYDEGTTYGNHGDHISKTYDY